MTYFITKNTVAVSPRRGLLDCVRQSSSAVLYACICTLIGFAWQVVQVYAAYHGNWSALFHHGYNVAVPHDEIFAGTYVFPTWGYDGEFYRMVAHDPVAKTHYHQIMDMARMRYRRILIPLLAYVTAVGKQGFIDATYLLWLLISIWFGVFLLAKYLTFWDYHPGWSCAYLVIPGVLSALEQATIDVALISVTIGFVYYSLTGETKKRYWLLMLAPLIRETGLILPVATSVYELARKRWLWSIGCIATLIPTCAWYVFVAMRIPPDREHHFTYVPLGKFWYHLLHHDTKPVFAENIAMQIGFYLGVAGILLAFTLSGWMWSRTRSLAFLAALGFTAVAVIFDSTGLWMSVKHFGRIFSPLLLLLALQYPSLKKRILVAPLLLMIPGSLLFSLTPLRDCLHGLLSH
ncbi:MAG: hypothetical protein WB676_32240 [Bryobacteraceae bacterium]